MTTPVYVKDNRHSMSHGITNFYKPVGGIDLYSAEYMMASLGELLNTEPPLYVVAPSGESRYNTINLNLRKLG